MQVLAQLGELDSEIAKYKRATKELKTKREEADRDRAELVELQVCNFC
jgi:hypothetical protein